MFMIIGLALAGSISAQTLGCYGWNAFSITTGISCTVPAVSLPYGCTSTNGYSPLTGIKCDTPVNASLPTGCVSTSGYSPTTGIKCDTSLANLPVGCLVGDVFSRTTGKSCNGVSSAPTVQANPSPVNNPANNPVNNTVSSGVNTVNTNGTPVAVPATPPPAPTCTISDVKFDNDGKPLFQNKRGESVGGDTIISFRWTSTNATEGYGQYANSIVAGIPQWQSERNLSQDTISDGVPIKNTVQSGVYYGGVSRSMQGKTTFRLYFKGLGGETTCDLEAFLKK